MNDTDAPDVTTLRNLCFSALADADIDHKAASVRAIDIDTLPIGSESSLTELPSVPGRPAQPLLLPTKDARRRSLATVEGRAALIHALAHIEFNAINIEQTDTSSHSVSRMCACTCSPGQRTRL